MSSKERFKPKKDEKSNSEALKFYDAPERRRVKNEVKERKFNNRIARGIKDASDTLQRVGREAKSAEKALREIQKSLKHVMNKRNSFLVKVFNKKEYKRLGLEEAKIIAQEKQANSDALAALEKKRRASEEMIRLSKLKAAIQKLKKGEAIQSQKMPADEVLAAVEGGLPELTWKEQRELEKKRKKRDKTPPKIIDLDVDPYLAKKTKVEPRSSATKETTGVDVYPAEVFDENQLTFYEHMNERTPLDPETALNKAQEIGDAYVNGEPYISQEDVIYATMDFFRAHFSNEEDTVTGQNKIYRSTMRACNDAERQRTESLKEQRARKKILGLFPNKKRVGFMKVILLTIATATAAIGTYAGTKNQGEIESTSTEVNRDVGASGIPPTYRPAGEVEHVNITEEATRITQEAQEKRQGVVETHVEVELPDNALLPLSEEANLTPEQLVARNDAIYNARYGRNR